MSDQMEKEEAVTDGVHGFGRDEDWVKPTDPAVLEHLEWFRDQKLGLFMHWGLYSQMGMMESWGLSDEDKEWSYGCWDWDEPKECQRQYRKLNRSFNPIRLQPAEWAKTAKACGFRYIILTTKHHDGFCLWDTALTNYRTTAPDCPFSEHKHADIIRHLFDAFRQEGLGIAAYFSKADWHTPYYWSPEHNKGGETSRGANYDPRQEPALWQKFVDFTHAQMMELVTKYGPLDALWLDAGWVNAESGEDIRLDLLAEKARRVTPGLLFVDRTVGGAYENILTPEHTIPEQPMQSPWESCLVLDHNGWGHSFDHHYKSARQILHLFLDIVSKGGNLALGVGPQPDGRLAPGAIRILRELGIWLEKNGKAVFETRICAPYRSGNWVFTRNGAVRFATLLLEETMPFTGDLMIPALPEMERIQSIRRLSDDQEICFQRTETGLLLQVPVPPEAAAPLALSFSLSE